jgi:2-polyprenyl-6-methoxyphenol hydroxylase-like FAD-dependent oxidoreductase
MERRTQVLIVGAGPVGLSAAIELGHRSVRCLLIERNDRVGHAPRAKTTNVRTREHLRRWGIADALRDASPLGINYPSDIVFVTKLNGYPLARFENAFYCAPGRDARYSEHAQWIPQYRLEEVLRDHAASLPSVAIEFRRELVSLRQDERSVRAEVRNLETGAIETIRCDYLIGADGSRSTVREAIGAHMHGTRGLSRNYNVVFRAPGLDQAHAHGRAIMYWQVNQRVPSLVGPMDRGDKWFFMPTQLPSGMKLRDVEAPSLIREATGIDLAYEILSSDEWVADRLIADRYRDRRVFLAGDAAHLHPPFGGYGMNMGVADAVDLGWKMAAQLQGWGGPALLESYERERRPVHEQVMDEAVANHALLSNDLFQDGVEDTSGEAVRAAIGARIRASKVREFKALGVVLGYRYRNSPIIVEDGIDPPACDPIDFAPCSYPGRLAPHAWLQDGRSLYDLFGSGFTLLARPEADQDAIDDARAAAQTVGIPLSLIKASEADVIERYDARYTLIRPDQHVAWRGDAWPKDQAGLLAQISGQAGGHVSDHMRAQSQQHHRSRRKP